MIDGINNSIIETDVLPVAEPTGSDENWAGNGFYASKTILRTTAEGARMSDSEKGRMWSFVNEDKLHYASKAPVGFKVKGHFLNSVPVSHPLTLSSLFRSCARICLHSLLNLIHLLDDELRSPPRICG